MESKVPSKAPARGIWGYALLGLGFVFCPCHLPITLPLLAAWLGGTAFTGFLNTNFALIVAVSTVLFLGMMGIGWWMISRQPACEVPAGKLRSRSVVNPKIKEIPYGTKE